MKNVFNPTGVAEIIERINKLASSSQPLWGKMSVSQMLAHCNMPYAYTFEPGRFKKPNPLMRLMLKTVVRKYVLSPEPYKKNGRTAPDFIITDERNFDAEKQKLISNIQQTQALGEKHFDGLENVSFGKMTAAEWNTMYYKHLDHHLSQFGV